MLALVLGSATHSFELMLSAFILGLALGAWWIRSRADQVQDPLRTLGLVQWAMGGLALATLPLYVASFDWIASLLSTFARTDAGYTGFTIARYGLCLVVMLPATFCAGMTLPLITQALLKNGSGERSIGAVYAWNTLGSILGVVLGGLVLLPLIGLKMMLIVGAGLDMAIGLLLLTRARPAKRRSPRLVIGAALAFGLVIVVVATRTRLDANLLSSGVYRAGFVVQPSERDMKFYRDGRTATVTVARFPNTGQLSLATNGKPDASLSPDWYRACDSISRPVPLLADAATQTLIPLITLAYAPRARTAAVIGQGSGMSSHLLLGSQYLKELVTIEIEPQMIAGSRLFYPANRRVFDDPRSKIAIDDAKSYFASAQRRYDLIISEPSNPWVSGVSGLFTSEFYSRTRGYLSDDGVFGQWLQVYELDDPLILSVLAGIQQNFRSYEIYLAPNSDLLVVASNRATLPQPDWSVFGYPDLRSDLCRFLPVTPEVLDALHLAGRRGAGAAPGIHSPAQLGLLSGPGSGCGTPSVPPGPRRRLPGVVHGLVQSARLPERQPFGSNSGSSAFAARESPGSRPGHGRVAPLDRCHRAVRPLDACRPTAGLRVAHLGKHGGITGGAGELGHLAAAGQPGRPASQWGNGGNTGPAVL